MIYSQVRGFWRQHGGDFDEMISVANVVFCQVYATPIDAAKGSFDTLLCTSIRRRLIDNMVIGHRRTKRLTSLDVEGENGQTRAGQIPDREHATFSFMDFARGMSTDAVEVLKLVIEAPAEVEQVALAKGGKRLNWQSTIRAYLRQAGWESSRITNSFTEIQGALQS